MICVKPNRISSPSFIIFSCICEDNSPAGLLVPRVRGDLHLYSLNSILTQVWNYMLYFRQCSIAASIVMYLPIAVRVIYLRKRAVSLYSLYFFAWRYTMKHNLVSHLLIYYRKSIKARPTLGDQDQCQSAPKTCQNYSVDW